MHRNVICLEGFIYEGNIYYTQEQLSNKNVISEGITRGVGKGTIQYEDTSTGKITTVETNAKEGESYEFTISNEGTYNIIVIDAAEKFAKELTELKISEIDITVKITGDIPEQVIMNLFSDSGFSQNYEFDAQNEYTLTNLPKYLNGEMIDYNIEVSVTGRYTYEVIKISDYNFVINYIYNIPSGAITSKTVLIVFNNGWNEDIQPPSSVEVILYRNGVEYSRETLSEDNGWNYSFTGLSNSYNWTIGLADEITEGYTTSIQNSGNITTIIFTKILD